MKKKQLDKKEVDQGKFFLHTPTNRPMKISGYGKDHLAGKDCWHVMADIFNGAFDQYDYKIIYDAKEIGESIAKPKLPAHSVKDKTATKEKKQAEEKRSSPEKKTTKSNNQKSTNQMKKKTAKKEQDYIPDDPADEYIREEFEGYMHNEYSRKNSELIPQDPADEKLKEDSEEDENTRK